MKKIIFLLVPLSMFSQFKIQGKIEDLNNKQIILKKADGANQVVIANGQTDPNGNFEFNIKEKYEGKLTIIYGLNKAFDLFCDNKNIKFNLNKENQIKYIDSSINLAYENYKSYSVKKDSLLPTLKQALTYYDNQTEFTKNLNQEIESLNSLKSTNLADYPLLDFYVNTNNKFLIPNLDKNQNQINNYLADFRNFFATTSEYLETSDLIKPLIFNYLNYSNFGATSMEDSTNKLDKSIGLLLDEVNRETERGQILQLAFIDLLDAYGIKDLSNKLTAQAGSLKCEVISSLNEKIKSKQNLKVGNIIANTIFTKNALNNTNSKSIYDVKSKYKIIMIWASYCSHCIREIEQFKNKYEDLKKLDAKIIGLSLDKEETSFLNVARNLPWINDSELALDESSYISKYNVLSTPMLYILDSNNKIIAENANFSQIFDYIK